MHVHTFVYTYTVSKLKPSTQSGGVNCSFGRAPPCGLRGDPKPYTLNAKP